MFFLVQAKKYLTLDFVRCISLWPQARRFLSKRDFNKRKVLSRITGVRHLVSWTKLFFYVPEMYKIYPFLFFLTETSE